MDLLTLEEPARDELTPEEQTRGRLLSLRSETNAARVSHPDGDKFLLVGSGERNANRPIYNGFGIPIQQHQHAYSGKALIKTKSGFYKQVFITLTNGELYIFSEVFSVKHQEVHILQPGVFVEGHAPIDLRGQNYNTVWPIQILLRSGKSTELKIFIYFDLADQWSRWLAQLERATGSYRVSEYYRFEGAGKYISYNTEESIVKARLLNFHKPDALQQVKIEELKLKHSDGQTLMFQGVHKLTNKAVDIKVISKANLSSSDMDSLRTEVAIFKSVAHNGIIRILDYFENSRNLYLCFERHINYDVRIATRDEAKSMKERGDHSAREPLSLQQYVISQTDSSGRTKAVTFDENRAIDIAQTIATALEYLHDIGIIVRDLETSGLVMTQNTDEGIPRISHLKNACCSSPDAETTGIYGDVHFRAPEVI